MSTDMNCAPHSTHLNLLIIKIRLGNETRAWCLSYDLDRPQTSAEVLLKVDK